MKCPHCTLHFHDNWMLGDVARGTNTGWHYRTALCPECKQMTIELSPPLSQELREQLGDKVKNTNMHLMGNVSDRFVQSNSEWRQVHPIGSNRGPVSPEVPPAIAADYVEACNVLPISAADKKRIAELNATLAAAGKPPSKS